MSNERLQLNYDGIPVLAAAFTDGKAVQDYLIHAFAPGDCTHALIITQDNGWKFGTEETISGLQENSLEKYTKPDNRIVAMYYWTGWDDPVRRAKAEEHLAEIRCKRKENSRYNLWGLLEFVPFVKDWEWVKKAAKGPEQWCSEDVLYIHDFCGFNSGWSNANRGPSPAELEILMQQRNDVVCVLNYYIGGGHA
jgi:hypothetical protein